MSKPYAGLGACWPPTPQGLQPHRGDCAFILVLLAPQPSSPPPTPRSDSGLGSQAERAPQAPRPRHHQGGGSRGRSRCAPRSLPPFRAQMPALPSLAPRRPPQEGQASSLKRHCPRKTPPRAGELPKSGKKDSPSVKRTGPPRSEAGPRTGPWRKGKAQDRSGLTQAAESGEKSRKGDHEGKGGNGDVQAGAWAEEEEARTYDQGGKRFKLKP